MDTTPAALFYGNYRCAASVTVRTAHTGAPLPARPIPPHGPVDECARRVLWLARSDGDVEVRGGAHSERVLCRVPCRRRAVVTALLQISGNRVAAGLSDGRLRVFDAATRQECHETWAHTSTITCMLALTMPTTCTPGETTATGTGTGTSTVTVTGFPRASVFLTASSDATIAKWDGVTLECLGRLKGHMCNITALAASLSGVFAFSGAEDGSIRMWSLLDDTQVLGPKQVKAKSKKTGKPAAAPLPTSTTSLEAIGITPLPLTAHQRMIQASATPSPRKANPLLRNAVSKRATSTAVSARAGGPRRRATRASPETPRRQRPLTARVLSYPPMPSPSLLAPVATPPLRLEATPQRRSSWNGQEKQQNTKHNPQDSWVHEVASSMNDHESEEDEGDEDISDMRRIAPVPTAAPGAPRLPLKSARKKTKRLKKPRAQFSEILQQMSRTARDSALGLCLAAAHDLLLSDSPDSTRFPFDAINPATPSDTPPHQQLHWPLRREHHQSITGLAVLVDRVLVSTSRDGTAKLFALPSGEMRTTLRRGPIPLSSLAVDEARCHVWISASDGTISVHDMTQPGAVPIRSWRDAGISHPVLFSIFPHSAAVRLCFVAAHKGKADASTASIDEYEKSIAHGMSQVRCVAIENVPEKTARRLYTLDAECTKLRCAAANDATEAGVFRSVLRRSVAPGAAESLESIRAEQAKVCQALLFARRNAQRRWLFVRWSQWLRRRLACRRRTRAVRFLEKIRFAQLLGAYFCRWRSHTMTLLRRRGTIGFNVIEQRACRVPVAVMKNAVPSCSALRGDAQLRRFAVSVCAAIGAAVQRQLMRRSYEHWRRSAKASRLFCTRAAAFGRLFLAGDDAAIVWRRAATAAVINQHRAHAFFLLHERMRVHQRKLCQRFFAVWRIFARGERRARRAVSLVEPLSAWLADESALRARAFFTWMRFARADVKLQRLVDEEATLRREWLIVQNAVESLATVAELRAEEERLELSIAQLAFHQDEVKERNAQKRAEADRVRAQRSLDALLAPFRDWCDPLRTVATIPTITGGVTAIGTTGTGRTGGGRRCFPSGVNSPLLPRTAAHGAEEEDAAVGLLRETGAVLRALKANAVRCGKHKQFISAAHQRVLRLPLYNVDTAGAVERSASVSFSSIGGDVSPPPAFVGVRRSSATFTEQRRSVAGATPLSSGVVSPIARNTSPHGNLSACGNGISLADEFDRVTQRLRVLLTDAARHAGVDLGSNNNNNNNAFYLNRHMYKSPRNSRYNDNDNSSSYSHYDIYSNGIGEYAPMDRTTLRWLSFVPATTQSEALPLLIDLVVMYDSFRAHSDTEVKNVGGTISTRSAPRVMPLPLRSLCSPHSAAWLVQHAAVLLELSAPGLWQRHLRELALLSDGDPQLSDYCNTTLPTTNTTTAASTHTNTTASVNTNTSANTTTTTPITTTIPIITATTTNTNTTSASVVRVATDGTAPRPAGRHRPTVWARTPRRPAAAAAAVAATVAAPTPQAKAKTKALDTETLNGASDEDPAGPLPLPAPSPAPYVMSYLPSASSPAAARPYLGFRVAVGHDDVGNTTLTMHEVVESYKCNAEESRGGPAFVAGLQAGDRLVRFAGCAVTDLAAFNAVVARHVRPAGTIPVVVLRKGVLVSAKIVVGEKKYGAA